MLFNKISNLTYQKWCRTNAKHILDNVCTKRWVDFQNMTDLEKEQNPSAETRDGYLQAIPLKEASKEWWSKLIDDNKQEIFALPNFSLAIFNDIMELKITQKEYKRLK